MNQAMDLAVVFSERNECTRENPVRVELGEGEHEMVGVAAPGIYGVTHMHVSCNNITIVEGKGKTTILGGFYVNGKQNIKMEQLSATNQDGYGLLCRGNGTDVDVMECCFKNCKWSGMGVIEGVTVTATRCDFMENGHHGAGCNGANTKVRLNDCQMHHNGCNGLWACLDAVVDLHGTKTDIHANKGCGIRAANRAKVNIHLPSQHNTTHGNVEKDRHQDFGGSIANINADGTFTHVETGGDDVD
jgi:hypothetical protein